MRMRTTLVLPLALPLSPPSNPQPPRKDYQPGRAYPTVLVPTAHTLALKDDSWESLRDYLADPTGPRRHCRLIHWVW